MGEIDNRSLEAEIAECCREIYWTTEADIAMKSWTRLRQLKAARDAQAAAQFRHEASLPPAKTPAPPR